jgi:hypothetical protein
MAPNSSEWYGASFRAIALLKGEYFPNRRGSTEMSALLIRVRIVRHVISRGERYGRLTVIREVQKASADGKRYRAALCLCDCGTEITPASPH